MSLLLSSFVHARERVDLYTFMASDGKLKRQIDEQIHKVCRLCKFATKLK